MGDEWKKYGKKKTKRREKQNNAFPNANPDQKHCLPDPNPDSETFPSGVDMESIGEENPPKNVMVFCLVSVTVSKLGLDLGSGFDLGLVQ